ncbi:MAG TPA: type I methionyl aminopeptidase [Candidatus Kaiserbacteria bacterium]|nr:type I methionyl aminopeptidase [Candidatus Kaiserbacteria bacterium]
MIVRTQEQKETLLEAGKRLGIVLETLAQAVSPGLSVDVLDTMAEKLIREKGDIPSFLNYTPEDFPRPYPASLCVSVNDEIVHGIPNENPRVLKDGDIVSLDLGLTHKKVIVDSALTVSVGKTDKKSYALMDATASALEAGIATLKPGNHLGDIGRAIQEVIEHAGFAVVKELGGHGVGDEVHEEPYISNYGKPGDGQELVEGMVLALEPISSAGKASVVLGNDDYTYRTRDGSRSAHFEHTILIEKDAPLVVTRRPSEI